MNISYDNQRAMTRICNISLIILACALMVACSGVRERSTVPYQQAEVRPPLSVPEGMTAVRPNPENQLPESGRTDASAARQNPPTAGLQDREERIAVQTPEPEVAPAATEIIRSIVVMEQEPILYTDHPVHVAWQTVGLGLERLNVPVVDRDRSAGKYYVDCVAASGKEPKKRRWWNVFSRRNNDQSPQCELSVRAKASNVEIQLTPNGGVPEQSEVTRLLEELKADLDRA